MQFDFDALPVQDRYKLIISTIVPRPIAWVTSLDKDGTPNAAPYSFFNAIGNDPPILMFSVQQNAQKRLKDTSHNILAAQEFVVNLVDEALAEAQNVTSIDAPPGVDELKLAGLAMAPSLKVKPPRIARSPVSYECRTHSIVSFGPNQAVVFGRIVQAHIADEFILDHEKLYLDTPAMKLIARTHGSGWYARTSYGIAVLRYEEVGALLRDPRLRQGSYKWPALNDATGRFADWWGRMLLNRVGADHARLRRLASPAFSPKLIAGLQPRFEAIANELIDAVAAAAARLLRTYPEGFTVSQLRDDLGVSRKYALPLVNELDGRGITRRRGDFRVAGPRLPSAGAGSAPA